MASAFHSVKIATIFSTNFYAKISWNQLYIIFSNWNVEFNLGSLVEESQNVHNTQRAQRALFFSLLVFVPWFHSSLKFLQMYFNLSDSQKCNIYSKHSSSKPWSWNYSQYKKRLPKLQRGLCIRSTFYVYVGWRRRRRRFFASNENRVHLFTHAISLDFHSRSRFYSSLPCAEQ